MNQPPPRDLRIQPLAQRKNLVLERDFAKVLPPVPGFGEFFRALPDIYGGRDLKRLVARIVAARRAGREVGVALGAHVLKVGLSPLVLDLMRRGFVTHDGSRAAALLGRRR